MIFVPYWPTSVNKTWRQAKGSTYLDPRVERFRVNVRAEIVRARLMGRLPDEPFDGPLKIKIRFFPPNCQRRDLDNLFKGPFDAFTFSGLWLDDSQVKAIDAALCEPVGIELAGFAFGIRELAEKK